MTPTVLTGQQMAQVLGISPCTLRVLAKTYDVPRIRRNNNRPLFNPEAVSACLAERLESEEDAVKTWRAALYRRYPEVVERVQALDKAISAGKKRRGYSLSMVPNKRHGFFYYVRYYDRGAMVPSRWSTGTNERLLAAYYEKRGKDGLLSVFENYYRKDSSYLEIDRRRHRTLCEQNRRAAYKFITYVFSHLSGRVFRKAYLTMGERLGKSGGDLKAENISFYSGRHFWKTLMNAGNLGEDAEEYWMGHAVSGDVAKTYNHRDKQGREVMLGKTREAFAILDRYLFGAPEAG